MSAAVSISEAAVMTAVRSFLLGLVPAGVEVVRAYVNGVPMPDGDFVAMSTFMQPRLSTAVASTDAAAEQMAVRQAVDWTVQLDCYGTTADQVASMIVAMARTEYAVGQFLGTGLSPLYADDATQMPIVNGEQQWEKRFRTALHLQANQQVTGIPQQCAHSLATGVVQGLP